MQRDRMMSAANVMRQKEQGIECNETERSADSAVRQKEQCRDCNETE